MPNSNTLSAFLIALFTVIVVAFVAISVELIATTTGSSAGGISVYAGGLGQRFISILVGGLFLIFMIVFLILRKALK